MLLSKLGLHARAGLHVGPVTLREAAASDVALGAKPVEVHGLAKPLAARIMALARGGSTLLSAVAADAIRPHLGPDQAITRHGHYRFKGVDDPVEVHELGLAHGPLPIPPVDGEKAYCVVRAGELWMPARDIRHNLPAERDSFVGRAHELRLLSQWLDDGARLITLLGTAGSGKTRLARHYGRAWLGDWNGGVYFCDLSEARSAYGIHFALAGALGIALSGADVSRQLAYALAGRGRCLVILDNFEQVVEHGSTIGRWLDLTTEAAFVITTRERLRLRGERILPVGSLPLDGAAIDLFVSRAMAQQPDFALDEDCRASVAALVEMLDGLPLAIELAVARVGILSPGQIVERLRDRFVVLGAARGGIDRQSTLRKAIDWSWNLLDPTEQATLAQCSVFEGAFTLTAAESVVVLPKDDGDASVLNAIQGLVDKSLLRGAMSALLDVSMRAEPRFSLYLSIHDYAADKLGPGTASASAAEARHGRYYGDRGPEPDTETTGSSVLRPESGAASRFDLDNLVTACRRACLRRDAATAVAAYRRSWQILDAVGPFALADELGAEVLAIPDLPTGLRVAALLTRAAAWRRLGRMNEAGEQLDALIALAEATGDSRAQAESLSLRGNVRLGQGRTDDGRRDLQRALVLFRELGDDRGEGHALNRMGSLASHTGHPQEARDNFEAALAIWRRLNDPHMKASSLGNIGTVFAELGDFDAARERYDEAIAILHELSASRDEAVFVYDLAILLFDFGKLEEARQCCESALAIFRDSGDRRFEGMAIGQLGDLHMRKGEASAARPVYEQSLAIAREIGDRRGEGYVLEALGNLSLRAGRLDEARGFLEGALALHRRNANPRWTGSALGSLAETLWRQGRMGDASRLLAEGEASLRQSNAPLELVTLLCVRGQVEAAQGLRSAARATLDEAEYSAQAIGIAASSRLQAGLDALRACLHSEISSPERR